MWLVMVSVNYSIVAQPRQYCTLNHQKSATIWYFASCQAKAHSVFQVQPLFATNNPHPHEVVIAQRLAVLYLPGTAWTSKKRRAQLSFHLLKTVLVNCLRGKYILGDNPLAVSVKGVLREVGIKPGIYFCRRIKRESTSWDIQITPR